MTEFGTVTQVKEQHVRRSGTPFIPRGEAPASPKFSGPSTYVQIVLSGATKFVTSYTCDHIVWETATKFCMVLKLDVSKILHGRPRMLTRDLFAVANLVLLRFRVTFQLAYIRAADQARNTASRLFECTLRLAIVSTQTESV